MEKYRFLLSGSGGQGVITMAILLAGAAALIRVAPVRLQTTPRPTRP